MTGRAAIAGSIGRLVGGLGAERPVALPPQEDVDRPGVSFVVPVHNGERWLDEVLSAILAQDDGRPMEVVAVDDRSVDGSPGILRAYAARGRVRVIDGQGDGAAAALNRGIRHATHRIICQVDQDVILRPGWMARLTAELSQPDRGAAQGRYLRPGAGTVWVRVMALDLEHRYGRIRGRDVDHVCTGNSAFRADALHKVGLFDERLGYGYDNDMSYRLGAAGYRLAFCHEATSEHRWPEGATAYLAQQYGFGYGRLDLIAKHRGRLTGDQVSGLGMILHAPLMLLVLATVGATILLRLAGGPWVPAAVVASGLLMLLAFERLAAGLRAAVRFRDPAGLWFAPIHLLRDVAWAMALAVWLVRRLAGRPSQPSDSMPRRESP
ncbi:MAG: glycosyltransferase [Candidatus Rokuibacteriota bacterium]